MDDQSGTYEEYSKSKENTGEPIKKPFLEAKFKNLVFLAFFMIIGLVLIMSVLYRFWANNQIKVIQQVTYNQKPNPIVPEKIVDEWNIYENKDLKFSLKYPKSWNYTISDGSLSSYVQTYRDTEQIISFHPWAVNEKGQGFRVDVYVYNSENGQVAMLSDPITSRNYYRLGNPYMYNIKLTPVDAGNTTEAVEKLYSEVFTKVLASFTILDEMTPKGCLVTGCSGQICSNKEVTTTCEMLPEYSCYRNALCETQNNGSCGWTMNDDLKECLRKAVNLE